MVTLNGLDITNIVTNITKIQRPKLVQSALGMHSIIQTQHRKNTVHEYQVSMVWTASNDYLNKETYIENMIDGGLPVWFDATDWYLNAQIFGKVHDMEITHKEAGPNIAEVKFVITSVNPWGYLQIISDGAGDFRIYDLDKFVQGRTYNPILRRAAWVKGSTTFDFWVYVKNVGASPGTVVIEMFIPDGLGTGDVSLNLSAGMTPAVGTVGTSGFSSTPGTLKRYTFSKAFNAGVEEEWHITITFGSNIKTSYIDGSIDDTSG